MKEQTQKKKPAWRTVSELNPAVSRRQALLIVGGFAAIMVLVLAPLCLHSFAGISERTSYIVIFASFGAVLVVLELFWLVLAAIQIPRQVRRSNELSRERKASGFYKTLPPVKDDDDD